MSPDFYLVPLCLCAFVPLCLCAFVPLCLCVEIKNARLENG
jgi:hypothetical protein